MADFESIILSSGGNKNNATDSVNKLATIGCKTSKVGTGKVESKEKDTTDKKLDR